MKAGDYSACSAWNYNSWKTKCCVKLYFHYKNGKKGQKTVCGDVPDLKSEMKKWGQLKYGHDGGWKNVYKAEFYCNEAKPAEANNQNYHQHLQKGHLVAWHAKDYKGKYDTYLSGKKYYPKDINEKFHSFEVPRGYEYFMVVKAKNGKNNEYQYEGKLGNLASLNRSYGFTATDDLWKYIQYFEIRKKGGAQQQAAAKNNAGYDYTEEDWYKKGGYIHFLSQTNFNGKHIARSPGSYQVRQLGLPPQSIHIPNSNIYLVMEYQDKAKKKRSTTIKTDIADLNKFLLELGIHKDYHKEPYEAITRLAVMRQ